MILILDKPATTLLSEQLKAKYERIGFIVQFLTN